MGGNFNEKGMIIMKHRYKTLNDKVSHELDIKHYKKPSLMKVIINKLKELNEKFNSKFKMSIQDNPLFLFEFSGIRNAVNQCIVYDDVNGHFYTSQSDSQNPEGFYINKLNPTGHFESYMHIKSGGHGTSFSIETCSEGVYIWLYHEALGKLIRVLYDDFKVHSSDDLSNHVDYTPQTLQGKYFTPTYDKHYKLFLLRTETGIVEAWKYDDIMNMTGKAKYRMVVPYEYRNDLNPMQGIASYDNIMYFQSGWGQPSNRMTIAKFDMKTGEELEKKVYNDMIYKNGKMQATGNYHEPEGMYLHVDSKGNESLLIAITTGDIAKRYNMLFVLTSIEGYQFWDNLRAMHTQTYQFIRGTGQALRVRSGYDDINEIPKSGYYTITNGEMKNIKNLPYDPGAQSWRMIITPYNQVFEKEQILIRISGQKKELMLKRSINYRYQDNSINYGQWMVYWGQGVYGEYISAESINYNLSNWVMYGEYYFTGAQRNLINDIPSIIPLGVGFTLRNCEYSVGDSQQRNINVTQYLTVNSETNYKKLIRYITYTDGKVVGVGKWRLIHDGAEIVE